MKRENNLWNQDKMKKGLRELKRRKKKKTMEKRITKDREVRLETSAN